MIGPPYRLKNWNSKINFSTILDGTSNTILFGEKHVKAGGFGKSQGDRSIYNGDPGNQNMARVAGPVNPLATSPYDAFNNQFGSYHSGICQFVLCDGTVRPLSILVDTTMLGYMAGRDDGGTVLLEF